MMQGTAELAVTVIGEQEQAQAVLEQIREIEQFTFEEGGEEDSILIHISTKDDVDIRKSLSVALAGAGMPILSMNRSEKSLEDIFLELTEMEEDLEGKDGTELSEESEQGETEPTEVSGTEDETDAHGVSAQEEASAAVTEKEETDIAAGETAAGKEETDESDL